MILKLKTQYFDITACKNCLEKKLTNNAALRANDAVEVSSTLYQKSGHKRRKGVTKYV